MILGFTVFLAGLVFLYLGFVNTDLKDVAEQFLSGNIIVKKKK